MTCRGATSPRRDAPAATLCADGLTLLRWRPRHVAALTAAIQTSRDHLAPWMPWVAAYDADPRAADHFVAAVDRAWGEGTEWSWGVWQQRMLVGAVGLHSRGEPGVLEIGYWTHVDHLGRGVARRAAAVVTCEALALAHVRRVEIRHADTNRRSARVPARLGYRWVGRVPRSPGEGGDSDTTVVWGLDAADLPGAPVEHLGLPSGST